MERRSGREEGDADEVGDDDDQKDEAEDVLELRAHEQRGRGLISQRRGAIGARDGLLWWRERGGRPSLCGGTGVPAGWRCRPSS